MTAVLAERERLGSTAIGDGIAIPHGKLPKVTKILGPSAVTFRASISNRSTATRRICFHAGRARRLHQPPSEGARACVAFAA